MRTDPYGIQLREDMQVLYGEEVTSAVMGTFRLPKEPSGLMHDLDMAIISRELRLRSAVEKRALDHAHLLTLAGDRLAQWLESASKRIEEKES